MRRLFFGLGIVLCTTGYTQAQFKNLIIATQVEGVYPPLEPSIAINRKDPKNIVAGVVLDRVIYTKDGGLSWKTTQLFGLLRGTKLMASNVRAERAAR